MVPIIDGHNDTVLRFYTEDVLELPRRDFFSENDSGHIDFPRAMAGGMLGGFFAIFSPNRFRAPRAVEDDFPGQKDAPETALTYATPLPAPVPQAHALRYTVAMLRRLYGWERQSEGRLRLVDSAASLKQCLNDGVLGLIVHIEGAEAIDPDLDALYVLYAAGLRSLGLVWSRPNAFGHGVPFNFPAGPDIGPGLTPAGKRLVRACNELGILVDMSHLNLAGFEDVAAISSAPLVCTHSGVHALCATPRNLLDSQIDAIAATNGVIGVNFHTGFLREDGRGNRPTPLTEIVRHATYIADRVGVEHVALGSDFDGATMPHDLKDVAGLPRLVEALAAHGFTAAEIDQIAHGNWLRVLHQTWGA